MRWSRGEANRSPSVDLSSRSSDWEQSPSALSQWPAWTLQQPIIASWLLVNALLLHPFIAITATAVVLHLPPPSPMSSPRVTVAPSLLLTFLLCLLGLVLCTATTASTASSPSPSSSASLLLPRAVRIEGLLVDAETATELSLVVDTQAPAFSWRLDDEVDAEGRRLPGITQRSYDLSVAPSSSSPLRWHEQSAAVNCTLHVRYSGPALQPDCVYRWRLRYESSSGAQSGWAEGQFRTGLLSPLSNLTGLWIGSQRINMNQLRREFSVPAGLQRATAFVLGLGLYELYFNGQQVDSTRRLDPGWTEYRLRSLYTSFDVTKMLLPGQSNCVGLLLGNGWYSAEQWGISNDVQHPDYGPPRLLFTLQLHLSNGSLLQITSDRSWTGREGFILHDGIYWGEDYSQPRERPDWSKAGFTDPLSLWLQAEEMPSPLVENGTISLQQMPPIRIGQAALHSDLLDTQTGHWTAGKSDAAPGMHGAPNGATSITPVYYGVATGVDVFDLGQVDARHSQLVTCIAAAYHRCSLSHCAVSVHCVQNIAGVCSFSLDASPLPSARHVQTRHAESINPRYPNGQVYPIINIDGLRGALSTNTFAFAGNASAGLTTYTPRFSYYGFRWFTVYHAYATLVTDSVVCYPVHSETRLIGSFSSSSDTLNQIQHNIIWSQRANSMGVPTACSQRDERSPWTGDNGLSVDEALYNLDLTLLYDNWLMLIRDVQSPDGAIPDVVPITNGYALADPNWGAAYGKVIMALYDHTGDVSIVARNWAGVRAWVERVRVDYLSHGLANLYGYYGDWVPPPPYPPANISLVSSFAFLGDVNTLVQLAQLLNDSSSASHYGALYAQLAKEFHSTFFSPADSCYGRCEQTSNALALALPGVVPANLTDAVLSSLVTDIKAKGHFTCGIIGISQLFPVLSTHGQHALALSLATATSYPSYGWQFNNEYDNATTCWELWDSCLEGSEMNSKNHVMYSSIGSWFYRHVAGVALNGLHEVSIRPRMGYDWTLLPSVRAELMTLKGRVIAAFNRTAALTTAVYVLLPANLDGHVVFEPAVKEAQPAVLRLDGEVVWSRDGGSRLHSEGQRGVLRVELDGRDWAGENLRADLQSGEYRFEAEWQQAEAEATTG